MLYDILQIRHPRRSDGGPRVHPERPDRFGVAATGEQGGAAMGGVIFRGESHLPEGIMTFTPLEAGKSGDALLAKVKSPVMVIF